MMKWRKIWDDPPSSKPNNQTHAQKREDREPRPSEGLIQTKKEEPYEHSERPKNPTLYVPPVEERGNRVTRRLCLWSLEKKKREKKIATKTAWETSETEPKAT